MTLTRTLRRTLAAALLAGVGLGAAAAAEVYREHHPRAAIDPAQGAAGDFSGTYGFWKDAAALERHRDWAGSTDPNAWKLNWKYPDLVDSGDVHAGHVAVDEGERFVRRAATREPGFLACLGEGQNGLKGVAAGYPKYDARLKRLMTVEARVEHCAKVELWDDVRQGSPLNTKIAAYVKSQSAGQPIRVDLSAAPVMAAYRRGEQLFYTKVGQLNFACASCHTPGSIMGHKLRGEVPTTPFGDAAHFPTYRTPVGEMESLHQRFGRCLNQMRAQPLKPGDPAYVDLEVFYTVLSNGYPITVPSIR